MSPLLTLAVLCLHRTCTGRTVTWPLSFSSVTSHFTGPSSLRWAILHFRLLMYRFDLMWIIRDRMFSNRWPKKKNLLSHQGQDGHCHCGEPERWSRYFSNPLFHFISRFSIETGWINLGRFYTYLEITFSGFNKIQNDVTRSFKKRVNFTPENPCTKYIFKNISEILKLHNLLISAYNAPNSRYLFLLRERTGLKVRGWPCCNVCAPVSTCEVYS